MGEGFLPLMPEQAELLPNGVREKLSQHSGTPWLRCSASNTSKLMNLWEVGNVWRYLCKHVLATEGGKTHLEFTQQNRMVKLGGPNSQNKSLRARWKPSLLTRFCGKGTIYKAWQRYLTIHIQTATKGFSDVIRAVTFWIPGKMKLNIYSGSSYT